MLPILLLILSAVHAQAGPTPTPIDLIELNHYYDAAGKLAYDQVILYEWSPDYRCHHVIAWYFATSLDHVPTKTRGGRYVVSVDYRGRELRVSSRLFRETWTCYDPERENKRLMPQKLRMDMGE